MGCLCGCGGDNVHCLRPNRPPSPNTFYETFWAPEFDYMLKTRLDEAARSLEPSKRIWWRETFGGCAPDREPSISEMCGLKRDEYGIWENMLRTSPSPFDDDTYDPRSRNLHSSHSSRELQRPTSPLKAPFRSHEEAASTHLKGYKYWWSLTSRAATPFKIGKGSTKNYTIHSSHLSSSHDSFTRTSTPPSVANIPMSSTHYTSDRSLSLEVQIGTQRYSAFAKGEQPTKEEHGMMQQQPETLRLRRNRDPGINVDRRRNVADRSPTSPTKAFPMREACEKSPERFWDDWTHADDTSGSVFRAPTASPNIRPLKSPTHYVPDRYSPLEFQPYSKDDPRLAKRKVYTAEEDEQFRQSGLRKLEATKLELYRHFGMPHERGKASSTESPPPNPRREHVKEVSSRHRMKKKIFTAGELQQSKHTLYQKIEAMKSRRNRRQGIAVYKDKESAAEISPSLFQVDCVEEMQSNTPVQKEKPTGEELQPFNTSLYQKIEAMKLRRSCRQGTAIYQFEGPNTESPIFIDQVKDLARSHLPIRLPLEQSTPSSPDNPSLIPQDDHGKEIPPNIPVEEVSNMSVKKEKPTAEEAQLFQRLLYQKVEAMKLKRNCRHGIAIYRYDDTDPQISSQVDNFAGMSSTALPTIIS
ncbi:hypothetical protein IMSHALPRED_001803 [Imshaugia aleurites]|uniref:Uncharacterized protein n=1 Tax=Imshaugia aleurites TaxID=172621 RepID=A0A8H3J3X3_9LECA|nr:hypothetical protein IMSHALPRED_001803 [Imshaugia aleurites]